MEDKGLTWKKYGDGTSTEPGEGTELSVWAGDRESTLTSPSGYTRTKASEEFVMHVGLSAQTDMICSAPCNHTHKLNTNCLHALFI